MMEGGLIDLIFALLIILAIYFLHTFYIGWNLWSWLNSICGIKKKFYLFIVLFLLSNSLFIARFFKDVTFLQWVAAYWMPIAVYSLLLLPLANLIVFLFGKFTTIHKKKTIFLTGSMVIAAFIFILVLGTYNAYHPVVREYQVTIDKKVEEHKTLRIAMASDMHFGLLSDKEHARRLVSEINSLNPEIILFPGDIIDDDPSQFTKQNIHQNLKRLKAPLGVYATLGNHDGYYEGEKLITKITKEINNSDIEVLRDEVILIDDSFYLVGREDYSNKDRASFKELINGINKDKPLIALDHQPNDLIAAEKSGIDLILSGHTHKGQLVPFITKFFFINDYGFWNKNNTHSIVSSGFGFWGTPIRIGSQSEIVLLEVTFSK
jgi:uncharacterized protein